MLLRFVRLSLILPAPGLLILATYTSKTDQHDTEYKLGRFNDTYWETVKSYLRVLDLCLPRRTLSDLKSLAVVHYLCELSRPYADRILFILKYPRLLLPQSEVLAVGDLFQVPGRLWRFTSLP